MQNILYCVTLAIFQILHNDSLAHLEMSRVSQYRICTLTPLTLLHNVTLAFCALSGLHSVLCLLPVEGTQHDIIKHHDNKTMSLR